MNILTKILVSTINYAPQYHIKSFRSIIQKINICLPFPWSECWWPMLGILLWSNMNDDVIVTIPASEHEVYHLLIHVHCLCSTAATYRTTWSSGMVVVCHHGLVEVAAITLQFWTATNHSPQFIREACVCEPWRLKTSEVEILQHTWVLQLSKSGPLLQTSENTPRTDTVFPNTVLWHWCKFILTLTVTLTVHHAVSVPCQQKLFSSFAPIFLRG